MPKITYIEPDGTARTDEAEIGSTVMETAISNSIPGIDAECGGACTCATCHVYVDPAWYEITGEPSTMEEDMLDFAYQVRPTSRLSCQIKVSPRSSTGWWWTRPRSRRKVSGNSSPAGRGRLRVSIDTRRTGGR